MHRRFGLALAALLASVAQAPAVELADGTYRCTLSSMHMGDMELANGTFKGPAFDGKYESEHPFEVTEAGTINWGGPLGGLSSGGNSVVSSVLKDAGGGSVGYDIMVQLESGNFHTVSCSPE